MFMRVSPFCLSFTIISCFTHAEKRKMLDKKSFRTENGLNRAGRTDKDKRTHEEAGRKGEMT